MQLHHRARRGLLAVAVAAATAFAAAPAAVADDADPGLGRAFSQVEPGVPGGTVEDDGAQALAAATVLADADWAYFQAVNVARIDAGVEPASRNPRLNAIAAAWATKQAASGGLSTDPSLESKLPAGWSDGYQAIYAGPATSAAEAIRVVARDYLPADTTYPTTTDVGVAVAEVPGPDGVNWYTIYQVSARYSHSSPQAGESTLYRFYRPSSGTHFYSTSKRERNSVIRDTGFRYEGPVAYVLKPTSTASGSRDLNRFYQPGTGTHFYTSTTREYRTVKTLPQYRLDGVTGKVYTTAGTGRTAMYRFYRPASGTHFYTASASERDSVKQLPGYTYEGIAFYLRKAS
ncbi:MULTISPECIES: CAP domain-containing protein [unclassified Cellulomonas]|uniref:CAP domain-containing protein n=1 Tax=unclassified Cellulomonas TaxID=2620175 RepID=UPI0024B7DDDE|nr:CAP domain-containing protein [Cellulomonas sp. ES6]WHP17211.1 hypothetical protein P9841_16745 [Cellulomonas sp. ES6]